MDDESIESKFQHLLEPALPLNENFELLYLHSTPQRCRKLVFVSSANKQLDSVSTHFPILIWCPPNDGKKVAIYALEILLYESSTTATLFVSKADSSGYYNGEHRLNVLEITRRLLSALLRFYVPQHKKVRIALFAKAQKEYLFLGSVENPRKHILSDAELVKWWARCIDGLGAEFVKPVRCALVVPGLSEIDVKRYFPTSPQLDWQVGDVFFDVVTGREAEDSALAVQRIPRFPDDPKSRFLDAIVAERRAKVVTRKQFWLELQTRQEFLLGKSVGIIGLEGSEVVPSLHDNISHLNGLSPRDMHRLKEHMVSLKFDNEVNAVDATAKLFSGIPPNCCFSMIGQAPVIQLPPKRPSTSISGSINTLNVVRRKKRA